MIPDAGEVITYGAIGAAITALGFVLGILRKLSPLFLLWHDFFADWNGEPARPGIAERPGVMARLAAVESLASSAKDSGVRAEGSAREGARAAGILGEQLRTVISAVAQLLPNHGTSLRDSVDRIERDLAVVTGRTTSGGHNV